MDARQHRREPVARLFVEGGVPEVMTQAESEESESSIQKGAGRYYLNVNVSGSWTVTVEEEK